MSRWSWLALLLIAATPTHAAAARPGKAVAPAPALSPSMYPVERYTLDNGLTVILHEDHSLPQVAGQWSDAE